VWVSVYDCVGIYIGPCNITSIAVMDYNTTSEVLEFTAAGEQCVSIPINMDGVLEEETEQFTVVLTTRDDAITIGQQFATVTIMESDGV